MEQIQKQKIIEDSGFAPSFSYYSSSNNKTLTAVAKVIREEQELARIHENGDIEGDDFEFSLVLSDEEIPIEENDSRGWTVFPVSDTSLLVTDEADREIKEIDASSAFTRSLKKLFVDEPEGSSTESGSKRWIFRYLLRQTANGCKQPTKVDSPKHKRNSGEISKTGHRWKPQTPVHEQFYVQRRAENEFGKRKTYLPYRKDLVGLFANVNGMGKMLSF